MQLQITSVCFENGSPGNLECFPITSISCLTKHAWHCVYLSLQLQETFSRFSWRFLSTVCVIIDRQSLCWSIFFFFVSLVFSLSVSGFTPLPLPHTHIPLIYFSLLRLTLSIHLSHLLSTTSIPLPLFLCLSPCQLYRSLHLSLTLSLI